MKVEQKKKRKVMRKEQTDFTFFTFAGYLSPGKASLLSTIHAHADSEWEDQPLFDHHCLKSVKEAERKIFPLGSLRPTWVPFIPQKRLLGDSAELGAHQLSVL